MKLYHFTTTRNLLLVSWSGLKPSPHPQSETWQTNGRPCVWLTRQESNAATAADVERYGKYDAEWKVGDPMFGGRERVTVHLERHDRNLIPYRDIAQPQHLSAMGLQAWPTWWCYFGHIPPSKIEPITVAQAIAGLELQIGIHPDLEARASYAAMRDQLSLQGADQLVAWKITK